jgi:hypothetical protein
MPSPESVTAARPFNFEFKAGKAAGKETETEKDRIERGKKVKREGKREKIAEGGAAAPPSSGKEAEGGGFPAAKKRVWTLSAGNGTYSAKELQSQQVSNPFIAAGIGRFSFNPEPKWTKARRITTVSK